MLITKPTTETETRASLRRFGEVDWDFTAQASESPFSSVHWHPCRFPSQIPAISIGRFSAPGDLILDPFMGSATTLVEAQRLRRASIGIDINPVSCLLARAKTLSDDSRAIQTHADALKLAISRDWNNIYPNPLPSKVQGDKWYMPRTLMSLRKLWKLVSDLDGDAGIIGQACFSAILLPACREDRHWGYVCDNTQPKGNREPDAKNLFLTTLDRLMLAYKDRHYPNTCTWPEARVVNGNALETLAKMPSDYVDCVVTSPPYFGVADYVKAQRLTMEWLSHEIEPLRRQEIGARSKRHRKNALESYLIEIKAAFQQVYRVMKGNAIGVVVFGQSPSRPDAQSKFVEDLKSLGFSVEMERHRQIPIGRRQMPSLARETVLLIRK